MRLAVWALASLALMAVPEAHAAEPDSAALLQEIKALKEVVGDLVKTVRDLEHRVTELEGRLPATTSAAPVKPLGVQGAAPATPATAAAPTPAMLQAATAVAGSAPTPTATASPTPVVRQATPSASPQVTAAVPQAAPIGANNQYVSPEAVLRANWSRVKADMDETEVATLLGPPSKKFTLDGRTVWYYSYPGTGSGSVFFTDGGRVTSRKSPFGWWDW